MFIQLIIYNDSFVRLYIILLRNIYIYAINVTKIVDAYGRF